MSQATMPRRRPWDFSAWTPECDRLYRDWTPYAERWTRLMESRLPGADWWTVAGNALWKAALTFDPGKGVTFQRWMNVNIRNELSGRLRTYRSRRDRLRRVGLMNHQGQEMPCVPPVVHDGFAWVDAGLPVPGDAEPPTKAATGV